MSGDALFGYDAAGPPGRAHCATIRLRLGLRILLLFFQAQRAQPRRLGITGGARGRELLFYQQRPPFPRIGKRAGASGCASLSGRHPPP